MYLHEIYKANLYQDYLLPTSRMFKESGEYCYAKRLGSWFKVKAN